MTSLCYTFSFVGNNVLMQTHTFQIFWSAWIMVINCIRLKYVGRVGIGLGHILQYRVTFNTTFSLTGLTQCTSTDLPNKWLVPEENVASLIQTTFSRMTTNYYKDLCLKQLPPKFLSCGSFLPWLCTSTLYRWTLYAHVSFPQQHEQGIVGINAHFITCPS